MNKELRELLARITAKKAEVREKAAAGDLEGAKAAKDELQKLQEKFDLLADLEDDERDEAGNGGADPAQSGGVPAKAKKSITAAFGDILRACARKKDPDAEDLEILGSVTNMNETTGADGGYTVPEDVRTFINELRRATDNLEALVNVEHVRTATGSRVIEVDAESTPFEDVDEAGDIPDAQGPQLRKISYAVKKVGGIFKATKELLADTAENIVRVLRRWIAKKMNATRNKKILACLDSFTETEMVTPVSITGLDEIKDIFNVKLDPAIAERASVLTNQDGFNFLDKLKDEKKNYIIQPDPVQATRRLLFGKYPVTVVSNRTLKSTGNKYPFYFGAFDEAVTLFDRDEITVESSTEAEGLWKKDLIGFKVRDRFDVQGVDTAAVVKGYYTQA